MMEKGLYDMIIKEIHDDFGAQISNVDLSISIKKEDPKTDNLNVKKMVTATDLFQSKSR